MKYQHSNNWLDRGIFISFVMLVAVLPLLEAPKNILSLILVSLVAYKVFSEKKIYRFLVYDVLIVLWLLAGVVITFNAMYVLDMPAGGLSDLVRFLLVGWTVSMINISRQERLTLLLTVVISTALGLVYGYTVCTTSGGGCIELNSVGHVNHSAIYAVLAYGILLSILHTETKDFSRLVRGALWAILPVFFVAFYMYTSRATAFMFLAITCIFIVFEVVQNTNYKRLGLSIVFLTVCTFVIVNYTPESIEKILHWSSLNSEQLTPRNKINNFSYYAFQLNPMLGTGFANYHTIGISDVVPIITEDKGMFDATLFLESSHAHNLYYGYLVHGGILAFSIMMSFWLYVMWILFSLLRNTSFMRQGKSIVYSSISASITILAIGFYNSTLHHENALLTFIVLGLLFSEYRRFKTTSER